MTEFKYTQHDDGPKGLGDVVVAGQNVSSLVSGFSIEANARETPAVVLRLVPRMLLLKLNPERVELDGPTTAFLRALGWQYVGNPDATTQAPSQDATAEIKRLRAVAEAARAALDTDPNSRAGSAVHIRLEAALDALPAQAPSHGPGADPS